jgi:hypothetical protein
LLFVDPPGVVFTVTCGPYGCDYAHDDIAHVTITIDSATEQGWRGSYTITRNNGATEKARFVAVPKKQQKAPAACL